MRVKITSSHKVSIRGQDGINSDHFSSVGLEMDFPDDTSPETNAQLLRQKSLLDLEVIYSAGVGAGAPVPWIQNELTRFAEWSKRRIQRAFDGEVRILVGGEVGETEDA